MSRQGLSVPMQELYNSWEYICKVAFWPGNQKYEGVPYEPSWRTFEGFVKDNWFRFYRARIKWERYQRVAPRDHHQGELKHKTTRFVRYKKVLGYTKENTVFTSPSDMMKNHVSTHKYMFEDQLLGTRDIKRILKKRGISLEMEVIVKRLKRGVDLFAPNEHSGYLWKGKYRNYMEIAQMEGLRYDHLRAYHLRNEPDLKKAVMHCKNYKQPPSYEFQGKQLQKIDICRIIAKELNMPEGTINGRFKKHGFNLDKLYAKRHQKL